jgi:hypothetical protein
MIAPGAAHGKSLILAGMPRKQAEMAGRAITNSLKVSQ